MFNPIVPLDEFTQEKKKFLGLICLELNTQQFIIDQMSAAEEVRDKECELSGKRYKMKMYMGH